jgi:ABC-2 type transport system permease protein
MKLTDNQVWAIVAAQWRSWLNKGPKSAWAMWLVYLFWYGFAAMLAWLAATLLPAVKDPARLAQVVELTLFGGLLYWQLIPILLASTGMALDLKRLLVYPVEPSKLFLIEVILRLSTGVEVAIVLSGVAVGLWRHPDAPWWGPLIFVPYMAFNMFLSAGVRDLLARLMAKRGIRELVVFGIVLVSALPQVLVMMFPPEQWKSAQVFGFLDRIPTLPLPWTMTAMTAVGDRAWWAAPVVLVWLAGGLWFGYKQFIAGLNWDKSEVKKDEPVKVSKPGRADGLKEWAFTLPSRLLPDPLGMLVEKEFRFLSRASRFRLAFTMGFSFGLIIWFPIAFRQGREGGVVAENFLVWVSLYATLILGDVLFWNCFGFDRQAVQTYFVVPVKFSTVLIGKNLAAVFFLLLEVTLVAVVCALLRVRVTLDKVLEAFAVTLLVCLLLLAMGNLVSVRYPRPADPASSWRNSSGGKSQFLLLVAYPLMSIPVGLAYLARYAFETQTAFYLALAGGYVVGAITYYVAMESAVEYAGREQEATIAALSKGEGPFGG